MITMEMLRAFAPRPSSMSRAAIWDGYAAAICDQPELFREYGITTPLRLAHLMAQWGHESGGFGILWESGAYTAQRIVEIFGQGRHSAGVSMAEAERIAALAGEARAEALFERVYGLGNPRKARELGNREPGDGAKYRGWGIQQITGRADHERLVKGDYSYRNAIKVALIEWREKGCNKAADADDLRKVTKLINGGLNGIDDRARRLVKAKQVFGEALPLANGLDRSVAEVLPPANDDPIPVAVPPKPTVRDLADMGSTKAAKADSTKKWSFRAMLASVAAWATDKITDLSPVDLKGGLDHANHFLDTAKVATSFAKENALLLCVVGAGIGYWLAHTFGEAIVRDFLEGRYRPREAGEKDS